MMAFLGIFLIVLALPLIIVYAISDKKNRLWRNLAILLGVVGIIIIGLGRIVGL
jgi:hypothetical protein